MTLPVQVLEEEDALAAPAAQSPRAMNPLVLNSAGLGLDPVGELRDLIRSYNPAVVCLSETKQKQRATERLKWSLGFRHGLCVESKGKGVAGSCCGGEIVLMCLFGHGVNII